MDFLPVAEKAGWGVEKGRERDSGWGPGLGLGES